MAGKKKRLRDGKCSCCRGERDRGKQRYCKKCHAKHMRENRPRHSQLAPLAKWKANARAYANTYLRRGKIKRRKCIKCGSKEAQMHHEDYSKPLQVDWVCRPCHLEIHRIEMEDRLKFPGVDIDKIHKEKR